MAGRDIGTVVLPNADLKIYIDANLEERAARRHQQRVTNGESADLTAVRDGIYQRDTLDSKRSTAPLSQAPDAIYLDTSTLSLEEAIETIHRIILEWVPKQ
jgi:cytidylate kinase